MEGKKRVGVFDSGIGGLSVLTACLQIVPACAYLYYGDNARAPYGSRSDEEIREFTFEAFDAFEALGVDAAIVACNTASAVCLEALRKRYAFPVLGMEPAVAPAARECERVVVLCTPKTAESARLARLLARYPDIWFEVEAPSGLAGAIEDHFLRNIPIDLSKHLVKKPCDGVVLGCTHYALLKSEISHFMGAKVFDGAEGTARHLKTLLKLGTNNHLKPLPPNSGIFQTELNICSESEVFFVGSGAKQNENLFVLKRMF